MVGGHMEHTGLSVVFISSLEVKAGVDTHVGCGDLDVFVVGNIDTGRIVHLVVGSGCDGERADSTLAVVKDSVYVGREHALIVVVHSHGGIGPPEECLRHVGAVVKHALDFKIGAAGTQGETCHTFLMEHAFHFAHPHCHRAVFVFLDSAVDRHIGAWAVVLWPVKLDTTRNPRPGQTDECRLDDMVVVDKVTLLDFVIGHLDTSAELGEHHHLYIFVFDKNGIVLFIGLFVGDRLDYRIGIHDTA